MIFNLTNDEATQILNTLAEQPYIKVYRLINKLQKQATEQQEKEDGNTDD